MRKRQQRRHEERSLKSSQPLASGFPAAEPRQTSGNWVLWVSLALIAVNLVVYAPARHYDFVNYDDPEYVSENPNVAAGLSWHNLSWALGTTSVANWHPLTWLSYMLDVQVYGLNAGPHHTTNLVLHVASTLLLFWVFYRMTGELGQSAFVAGMFAVHPLHVESVAWLGERKDVLSTLFWMLTLLAYVEYVRRPGLGRYLAVFAFLALGLMAKPMLVTLPFVLLLLDLWPLRRIRVGSGAGGLRLESGENQSTTPLKLFLEKIPLLVLAAASSAITFVVQRRSGSVASFDALPMSERVQNALVSCVAYIGKMLWPTHLAAFYPYFKQPLAAWALGAVVLIGVSAFAVRGVRSRPYILVGWLWYLGTLAPVIGLVQVGSQSMADRYTYIPLIGLFVVAAWGIPELFAHLPHRRMALPIAAGLVILICAIVARAQVQHWENSQALWQHALEVTTNNYVAHNNLGYVLNQKMQTNEAMAHFSEALRLKPDYPEAHNNLGMGLRSLGKTDEALAHFSEALRLKPDYAPALNNFGMTLADRGRVDEAIAYYSEALRLNPNSAETHNNLGGAWASKARFTEALPHYAEALRLRPGFAEAHQNLGLALAALGRPDEAIGSYKEALRLKPDYGEAHDNLGIVLAGQGRTEEAIFQYSEALRLNPDSAEAHQNLGIALARLGRLNEAMTHFSAAVRLKPEDASAHGNLASALAGQGRLDDAVAEYSVALRIKPDYADAHSNLGVTLLRQGRVAEALAHLSESLRINPDLADAHNNMGVVLAKQGKVNDAIREFSEVLRINPSHAKARQMLNDLTKQTRKSGAGT